MSEELKAILYCDAGFLIDKRLGGFGIHGYTFTGEVPKRGTGNAKAIATAIGYVEAAEPDEKVTIVNYIDMCGAIPSAFSSNEAELVAFGKAMEYLLANIEVVEAKIYSDSRYVVQGINNWAEKWKSNGWKGSSGDIVKYKDLWVSTVDLWDELRATKPVTMEWIKGHNGHLGNECSDKMADKGLSLALNEDDENYCKVSDAQGYWSNASTTLPRMLDAPRFYTFTFDRERHLQTEGPFIYYTGTHGGKDKDHDFVGKVYTCNYLAVIKCKEADPIMETLIKEIYDLEDQRSGHVGAIVICNSQNLLSRRTYTEISEDGLRFARKSKKPLSISTSTGNELALELTPVGRGFRMLEVCASMHTILDEVDAGSANYVYEDLIPEFFMEVETKKGVVRKIKDTIDSSVKSIRYEGLFSTDKENKETFRQKVVLLLGDDLPDRNQLSAMATEVESMRFVSWRESNDSCRYGVHFVLKNGDSGFWCRYDSNLLLVRKK